MSRGRQCARGAEFHLPEVSRLSIAARKTLQFRGCDSELMCLLGGRHNVYSISVNVVRLGIRGGEQLARWDSHSRAVLRQMIQPDLS